MKADRAILFMQMINAWMIVFIIVSSAALAFVRL